MISHLKGTETFCFNFSLMSSCSVWGPNVWRIKMLQGAGVNLWHQLQYFKATIEEFACNMVTVPTLVLSVMFLEKYENIKNKTKTTAQAQTHERKWFSVLRKYRFQILRAKLCAVQSAFSGCTEVRKDAVWREPAKLTAKKRRWNRCTFKIKESLYHSMNRFVLDVCLFFTFYTHSYNCLFSLSFRL